MVPAYPAAQEVVRRIQPHYAQHIASAVGYEAAPLPSGELMTAMIDAAFWASLRREEGFIPKISLAFVSPERSAEALFFGRALPLTPEALTRLAPAVERAGIHLAVCKSGDELVVWGTTRHLPPYCFVLEVISPGVLVLKHSPAKDAGKYGNVAVLEGDKIKVLAQHKELPRHCPPHLHALLEIGSSSAVDPAANVLQELAVSMRAHGRGGAVILVPSEAETWRESIHATSYPVEPPFIELARLVSSSDSNANEPQWHGRLQHTIDAIAGLTAVDGATVITHDYRLMAFGAKIRRRTGFPSVERVLLIEPIEDFAPEVIDSVQVGGTRHLSAAQFAHDQRDACALVASQDGRFTLLAWSENDDMVHAHRIDTLLM